MAPAPPPTFALTVSERSGEKPTTSRSLQASIDGIRYRADEETKQAQAMATKAQKSASVQVLRAEERARAAEARLDAEAQASRRYAAANATLHQSVRVIPGSPVPMPTPTADFTLWLLQITKLRRKLQALRGKRGVVGSDSDGGEDAAARAPGPSLPTRASGRTELSRSDLSPSPPASVTGLDDVCINNNSTLLGHSPRKQRHARTALVEWDLSHEEERSARHGGGSGGSGNDDDDDDDHIEGDQGEDDELEYVDVATGAPAPAARPKLPTFRGEVIELSDDDDDSEPDVVASSYFPREGGRRQATVAAAPPPAASTLSGTSVHPASQRATGGPLATLTNQSHEHPVWKKATGASSSKQDKHLPDFSRGRVETGVKRHVKRK